MIFNFMYINENLLNLRGKMEKIKHLQIHLYLGNEKPQSAENEIIWLLVQYYTIHTVIDKLFEFHFHDY